VFRNAHWRKEWSGSVPGGRGDSATPIIANEREYHLHFQLQRTYLQRILLAPQQRPSGHACRVRGAWRVGRPMRWNRRRRAGIASRRCAVWEQGRWMRKGPGDEDAAVGIQYQPKKTSTNDHNDILVTLTSFKPSLQDPATSGAIRCLVCHSKSD